MRCGIFFPATRVRRLVKYEAVLRHAFSFLCIDIFAGGADEDELFQTCSKFWDRPDVLHGVAARGAYQIGMLSGSGSEHSLAGIEGA